jgi:WD40 repeat protein
LKPDEIASAPRELTDQQYPLGSATVVSPDGNWVAQLAKIDGIDRVDLISTSGSPRYVLRHPGGVWAAPVFSHDSRWLATGGLRDGSVRLWDVKASDPTAKPLVLHGHRSVIRSLDFSVDGPRLVSGARDGTAIVWDLKASGEAANRTTLPGGDVKSVAISASGRFVITGAWAPDNDPNGNDAGIWDLTSPTAPKSLARFAFANRVFDVDTSRDSRWAAAGSWDSTIQLFNLTKADAKPFTLSGHTGRTISVAFSPDNHWLATGNDDRTVRLWSLDEADPSSSSVVLSATYGLGLSFSPDGRWVAMSPTEYRSNPFTPDSQSLVSSFPETHLYLTRLEDLVSLACSTAGKRAFASEADQSLYNKHCLPTRAQ